MRVWDLDLGESWCLGVGGGGGGGTGWGSAR